jgi:phosphoglycerate kinase
MIIGENMKLLKDMDINNKTVIVRCDYNVPIKDGIIEDDSRIVKSLETINYLIDHNCKIVLLSHLGRVKTPEDKEKNSLKLVAEHLSKLLNRNVTFVSECYGEEVKKTVMEHNSGDIIMLENTRYMDLEGKLESGNNPDLAKFWASLGDVFVLDAFGSAHRAHASTAGIASFIPSCVGLLIEKELDNLKDLINVEIRPFTIFMGGAKVEDKLPIIEKLLPECDHLLLGGGIANSFLKASGVEVGTSLATSDEELLAKLKVLLTNYQDKIMLPLDFVYDGSSIMDIGPMSLENYARVINESKLIFINGTPGKFEDEPFAEGTIKLLSILASCGAKVITGGGDTVNALKKFGYEDKFFFCSSGGGATLEYIANKELEALKCLE